MQMRLAMRSEGNWWVAYAAQMGTMDGAVELGRIGMGIVTRKRRHKRAFMDLMQASFATILKDLGAGEVSGFEEQPAPQHERSGRA